MTPALLGLSSPATEHHAIPKTYALVRLALTQGADQLHRAIAHLPSQDHLPVPLRRVHSGMNGVFGDKLQEWGHPLALSMEVVDEQGRVQSLSESSFDSWIKDKTDFSTAYNTETNFYTKGSEVSFMLDMTIRRATEDRKSLDDVMRLMYRRFPFPAPGC